MQLLLQVGHLKFPKSREITALGCKELDAVHPHTRGPRLRTPALLPWRGQSPLPSATPGFTIRAARGSAPPRRDPSHQTPPRKAPQAGHREATAAGSRLGAGK